MKLRESIDIVNVFIILVFVYDWDDTFLCTTYLNHFQFVHLK